MKKAAGIILKILGGLVLVVLLLVFTVPFLFRDKIRAKVEQAVNSSVNARVTFGDYRLSILRSFPNLTFSLSNVDVAGTGRFAGDTLASLQSVNLVFNLASLFRKTGYEISSVTINKASITTIVLKDGAANWDIMKETAGEEAPSAQPSGSEMKILLRKVDVRNSTIVYIDSSSDISARLNRVNFSLTGDMTTSVTNLDIIMNAGEVSFVMDGMKYLNRIAADAKVNLRANLDSMNFYLRDNYLHMNDMKIFFAGKVSMPGDDIITDLTFKTDGNSLKSLLSLIPAAYTADFKDLKTSGDFSFDGSAKGRYSDADSTMPDILLNFRISNGLISYPSLPEQIKNINISSRIFFDGKKTDNSTLDVDRFHMELAGNPFDMALSLRTPVSDPDFKGSVRGRIDLSALGKAMPLDSISLSGIINASVEMAGRMSWLEKGMYDKFRASGNLEVSNMNVAMKDYPEVTVSSAAFEFTPAYAVLKKADLLIGRKSDFSLSGKLGNYIPYFLSNKTLTGSLDLQSRETNLTEIMSKMASDTSSVSDTSSLAVIKVPENIDFNFNASISRFIYNKINLTNVKGNILVKNGILSIRNTGMDLLGGSIKMNADYDTRDTLKPAVRADMDISNLGIRDAFNTFNTIKKLAPTADGIDGRVNVKLAYSSLLKRDMMPLLSSISGEGKLQTNEVTLLKSKVYNQMKEALKLGDNYSNTFRDLNISFKISNGRILVSPFDTKVGNVKMNISGDQGIDQTINYFVKTQIPRSDLGKSVNSLIDNLSAQASAFGLSVKLADIMKINVKVTGTFRKPVVTPVFGNQPADSSGIKGTVREEVKQAVDTGIDKAREKALAEAQQQGDRLVAEAEEKGRQLHEEAVKAADKIRSEADDRAKKLVRDAEPKGPFAVAAAKKAADVLTKEASKKADQVVTGADSQSTRLVDDAKQKREELINKLK
jgi:uncharacterized protein involved in outer membrane biogenesis